MEFLPGLDTYDQDQAVQNIWEQLSPKLSDKDGICYYKHPIIQSVSSNAPDLALIAEGLEPLVLKCLPYNIDEINSVSESTWQINDAIIDSPVFELDDFIVTLAGKFDKQRILRRRLRPIGVLVFPLITRLAFENKFGPITNLESASNNIVKLIWKDLNLSEILIPQTQALKDREWLAAKSVFQGVNPLNRQITDVPDNSTTLGGAIKILEKEIALLDEQQHKVAIQMAPGPQRIRGLAGTGKTVVLAMKAANIHRRYPEKNILFTFHTQSLYNQIQSLITKFYKEYTDNEPNWEKIHVRHGWGGAVRPGVYSDLCKRLGIRPLDFIMAKRYDAQIPFRSCCKEALKQKIEPIYDFILVDEAQDFPVEFFHILAKLITPEKRIYFAYDELQSLSSIEIPRPEDLFGLDAEGKPFITLEGDYSGGIEKDFVLHKSYRCPLDVLVLAHGIGLGIHGPHGCVQMLSKKSSWESIGYEIEKGNLITGEETEIVRRTDNSPNRIKQIYTGTNPIIRVEVFDSIREEIEWVAESIHKDITEENVSPEDIIVICLDTKIAKDSYFIPLQVALGQKKIGSTIPGLVNDSWKFAEAGRVTLSTVYRAKGNEAPLVYIISFDALYSYVEEIDSRNKAFTSISRSKGWVRITGAGKQMKKVKEEIDKIISDIPRLRFIFPDMDNIRIRKLDTSETTRRKKIVGKGKQSVKTLLNIDSEALSDIDPESLKQLIAKLKEVSGDSK